jgi:hypothetical protein
VVGLLLAITQANAQPCTKESLLKLPGKVVDVPYKLATSWDFSAAELAAAKKNLTAIEQVCKKNLVFTGGQAKPIFSGNGRGWYTGEYKYYSYSYSLRFDKFNCDAAGKVVVGGLGTILNININPKFAEPAFPLLTGNNWEAQYYRKNPKSTESEELVPYINIYYYHAISDPKIADAVNNGNEFINLHEERLSNITMFITGNWNTGYSLVTSGELVKATGRTDVYRHRYFTHTDIPFLIPVTRKKFMEDLLEYYEREKTHKTEHYTKMIKDQKAYIASHQDIKAELMAMEKEHLANFETDYNDVLTVYNQKKAIAQNLLKTKDAGWLNGQAAVNYGTMILKQRTFGIEIDPKANRTPDYGEFYFNNGVYAENDGVKLYQVNPEYLKKYPPSGSKPSMIEVVYRLRAMNAFGNGINDSYINNHLDMEGIRKMIN